MHHEQRLGSLKDQKDQDSRNLEQLRGWLNQAQDKLSGAHESLKATRQHKSDMEERFQQESKTRSEAEDIERQLIGEMEDKMEEDRKFREEREQELLSLEEERRKYERMLRESESACDDELRKRKVVEARTIKVDQQYKKIEEDNERLVMMLREAEDARATIEQAKAETEAKNKKIEEELLSIDEQSAKRQAYIEELKQKLESERLRLEQELRSQQEGRKTDATGFKQKEEDLLVQISKASEDVRLAKDEQEDKRRKFETNIARLEQEVKSLEAALKAEESLTEALRERCSVLSEQLVMIEEELKVSAEELISLQAKLKTAEDEKLQAMERERAMNGELQKEIEAEPEKINAIESMKRKLEEERRDKEKELHEAKASERTTAVEKDEAEHTLRRFRDDGQLMVDNERRRLERELQFKKAHEDCVAQYESTVQAQEDLLKCVSEVKLPVEEYKKYADGAHIFDDTVPQQARPLDAVPQMQQPPQGQPHVTVIPASQGYPMLSQSMHSYGGMMMREPQQVGALSYTSSLLGSNQIIGQAYQSQQPQLSASFNAQPSYNLGSSMSGLSVQQRDNGQYI